MLKILPASAFAWTMAGCILPQLFSQSQWAIESGRITDIVYGPAGFVAVSSPDGNGNPSTIYHSVDGSQWTSLGRSETTRHVISAFGAYFLSDSGEKLLRKSVNGRHWNFTDIKGSVYGQMRLVNNRLFSFAGQSASITDDGHTWTNLPLALRDVTFGHGRYVGIDHQAFHVSTNLAAWSSIPTGTNEFFAIAFGNNRFVASTYRDTIAYSDDGLNWTPVQVTINRSISLRFVGDRFITTGTEGTILTSKDGRDWIREKSPVNVTLGAAAFGDGRYIIGGDQGTFLLSEGDGEWHVVRNAPIAGTDLVAGHGQLAGIIYGTTLVRSPGGNLWEETDISSLGYFNGISVTPTGFLMVGTNGQTALSTNLIDWSTARAPTTNALAAACFAEDIYVAVGNYGTVVSSSDAVDWRLRTLGSVSLTDVTHGNDTFVAVGTGATIISSPDGISWILRSSGNVRLHGVAFGQGLFVAVGTHRGTVMTSSDGIQWKNESRGSQFHCVTFTGHEFVAGGDFGSLSYSRNGVEWSWLHATMGNTTAVTYKDGLFYAFSGHGLMTAHRDLVLGHPVYLDGSWRIPITGLATNRATLYGSADFVNWEQSASIHGLGENETNVVLSATPNRQFFRLQSDHNEEDL